jgi:hypothetical protein
MSKQTTEKRRAGQWPENVMNQQEMLSAVSGSNIFGLGSAILAAYESDYRSDMQISTKLVLQMALRIAELEKRLSIAETMGDKAQAKRDLEQQEKAISILYKSGKCDADSWEFVKANGGTS